MACSLSYQECACVFVCDGKEGKEKPLLTTSGINLMITVYSAVHSGF